MNLFGEWRIQVKQLQLSYTGCVVIGTWWVSIVSTWVCPPFLYTISYPSWYGVFICPRLHLWGGGRTASILFSAVMTCPRYSTLESIKVHLSLFSRIPYATSRLFAGPMFAGALPLIHLWTLWINMELLAYFGLDLIHSWTAHCDDLNYPLILRL